MAPSTKSCAPKSKAASPALKAEAKRKGVKLMKKVGDKYKYRTAAELKRLIAAKSSSCKSGAAVKKTVAAKKKTGVKKCGPGKKPVGKRGYCIYTGTAPKVGCRPGKKPVGKNKWCVLVKE